MDILLILFFVFIILLIATYFNMYYIGSYYDRSILLYELKIALNQLAIIILKSKINKINKKDEA